MSKFSKKTLGIFLVMFLSIVVLSACGGSVATDEPTAQVNAGDAPAATPSPTPSPTPEPTPTPAPANPLADSPLVGRWRTGDMFISTVEFFPDGTGVEELTILEPDLDVRLYFTWNTVSGRLSQTVTARSISGIVISVGVHGHPPAAISWPALYPDMGSRARGMRSRPFVRNLGINDGIGDERTPLHGTWVDYFPGPPISWQDSVFLTFNDDGTGHDNIVFGTKTFDFEWSFDEEAQKIITTFYIESVAVDYSLSGGELTIFPSDPAYSPISFSRLGGS